MTQTAPTETTRPPDGAAPMRRVVRPPAQEVELTPEEAEREFQGDNLDPLEELLAYDSERRFEEVLDMSKYGFQAKWEIQNLQGEQHSTLIERASRVVKNTGNGSLQKQLDGAKFQALVVAYGVKSPNLRDPKVFRKYNLRPTQEDRLISAMFKNKPGLLNYVANAVLELSGFNEDLVEVAKSSD
jgi:hypothetical protein